MSIEVRKEAEFSEESDTMPSQWVENLKERRKIVEETLSNTLKTIISSNPALEILNVHEVRLYDTKNIFYTKDGQKKPENDSKKAPRHNHSNREVCYKSMRV